MARTGTGNCRYPAQVVDAVQSALMERAVATGREAANVALLKDDVRQVDLPHLRRKGPGLI